MNAYSNAQQYYSSKKKFAQKADKTMMSADKAIKGAARKVTQPQHETYSQLICKYDAFTYSSGCACDVSWNSVLRMHCFAFA
jgi:hypothetical protein